MDDRNETMGADLGSAEPKLLFLGDLEAQGDLFSAVAKARKAFKAVRNDTQGMMGNRVYKYADLQTLVEATSDALSDHGVTVLQFMTGPNADGSHRITTVVSGYGAQIHSLIDYSRAGDIKSWGSQTTYLRRYAYRAIFMLDGSDDADSTDQGRQETPRTQGRPPSPPPKPAAQKPAAPPPKPAPKPAEPEPLPPPAEVGPVDEDEKTIVEAPQMPVDPEGGVRKITIELKDAIKAAIASGAQMGVIDKAGVDALCRKLLGKSGQELFSAGSISEGETILAAIRAKL